MTETPERTAVYRIRGEADVLLYIGMTNSVVFRWNGHQAIQPWWDEVRSIAIEWYGTRDDAAEAEKAAIEAERPKYNVTYLKSARGRQGGGRAEAVPIDLESVELEPQDDDDDLLNLKDICEMVRIPYPSAAKAALRNTGGPRGFKLGKEIHLFRKGEIRRWIAAVEASQRDSRLLPVLSDLAVADDAPVAGSSVASTPKRRRARRTDQGALFDVNGSVA